MGPLSWRGTETRRTTVRVDGTALSAALGFIPIYAKRNAAQALLYPKLSPLSTKKSCVL
ncbi:hypothetical protein KL86CLO1_13387 [uncultured Eubacteriales bacterium]|uniref:Uncharacterized protein n=1 Tax=uncultured Eubacteriales bacterium TaxID=172733 RepID=A0A212KJE2_9FIRM|nr:hypothetical protein KL86CLO1_13387 [uncultured Eubacteriales bacterium]